MINVFNSIPLNSICLPIISKDNEIQMKEVTDNFIPVIRQLNKKIVNSVVNP